ncbi:gamma-glutamylcyclotransferase [Kineosporia babensis]|uniref:Gamma-glutamylcyclotransferase n=1 Tax=Kineosporia babensis TaxID=499548 RepID=A0A9X1SVH7_9ACTN|nr:gamma-glutamylcyclotransferase [Kineosporia babensis]MCD5313674.1 gamma-glutamylcyclotransferase [Kineosporia babensis]
MQNPVVTSSRARVVGRIADHLAALDPGHPLRVGVDGITAAGKTTLAAELAVAVRERGRPVILLSFDGYHHPRSRRHRQGRESADGYYEDAYNTEAMRSELLDRLGPGGDGRYRPAVLDLAGDQPVKDEPLTAPANAVLLTDGSFLQRPELVDGWDQVVYLDVDFEVAQTRGAERDTELLGGPQRAAELFVKRYHAACRRYLAENDPRGRAQIVVANNDPAAARLVRIGGAEGDSVQLFSYGTLQLPEVQRSQFGRLLDGQPDQITGYRQDWLTITDPAVIAASGTDRHPVVGAGAPGDSVSGTVFSITPDELAAADLYEVDEYRRRLVPLASGGSAWVYLRL